jgi:nucleoside-diphosphate-sugar epimerase
LASLLIIGGSGFFGKSFVDFYNEKSFKKWGINKLLITSRSSQMVGGHKAIQYDSSNYTLLDEVDYIIYAASTTDSQTYDTNFKKEIDSQKKGMKNFQRLINSFKNPPKILYTSSGAVYGQTNLNNSLTDELSTKPNPNDNNEVKKVYANIKLEWEEFLLDNYPNQLVIARCFAFVGSRLPLNKHFVIGNFIENYINRKNINVTAKNFVYRSYMYADDMVEWLLTILTSSKNTKNNTFNVGSPEEIEIHDLANIFMQKMDLKPLNYIVDKNLLFDRYIPDISNLKKTYNLKLKYELNQSINKTIDLLKIL